MLIQCTKKLLSELKVESTTMPSEVDERFSWHANLLTLNRRKTVVLMNDSNRYLIVLYGLKAKDFKNLDELFIHAICETFRAEGIKEEIIEAYISESKEITYTTTKNRTLVARLNKSCEQVYFYSRDLNQQAINQLSINKDASRLYVGNGSKDHIKPNKALYQDLENLTSSWPIFQSEAFILHIKLNLENHPIWRRVAVPKHFTFPELHKTIQNIFGWQNSHLHDFMIFPSRPLSLGSRKQLDDRRPLINLVCSPEAFNYEGEIPMRLETDEKLLNYLPADILYTYDFGDGWEHEISIEEVIDDYEWNYPVCLGAEGNTPPEDVGGEPGFENFLGIIADPNHPDHKSMKSWGREQGYKDFDIERTNRILKYM
jgi:hypothetical protein